MKRLGHDRRLGDHAPSQRAVPMITYEIYMLAGIAVVVLPVWLALR